MIRFIIIIAAAFGFAIGLNAQTHNFEDRLHVVNETFYLNGVPLTEGELSYILGDEIYISRHLIPGSCFISILTLIGLIPSILHFSMTKNTVKTYTSIAESYNKSTGKVMELTLSPASKGFGIALNF